MIALAGYVLIAVGGMLSLLAAWGVADFPTPLARMHAATKSASLGLALLVLGSGLVAESWGLLGLAALVAVFLFITAPISGHLLGRAAYLAGQTPGLVHDDLAAAAPPGAPLVRPRGPARFSLLRIGLVTVVWVLLWRDPAPGVWAGGVLVAGLIEIGRGGGSRHALMRPGGLLRFVARYMVRVIKSNLEVAWEVITPSNDRIREAIVAVPLDVESPAIALLVANAVSFTPGTLTVELTANPLVVYVHVLHFESAAAVRREVAGLADLAAHAFVQSVGR